MTAPARAFLHVRVTPRAARATLERDGQGILRARLTAAPVDGRANTALIDLLAERLDLPKSAFELTRGARAREKTLCVRGCSPDDLALRIDAALGFRR